MDMSGGCKFTLREYDSSEQCNHLMGVDLEIWFMLCSFLIIIALVFFRIIYGAIKGEKLSVMVEDLMEPMDDDGELKIGNVVGILGTFAKEDVD